MSGGKEEGWLKKCDTERMRIPGSLDPQWEPILQIWVTGQMIVPWIGLGTRKGKTSGVAEAMSPAENVNSRWFWLRHQRLFKLQMWLGVHVRGSTEKMPWQDQPIGSLWGIFLVDGWWRGHCGTWKMAQQVKHGLCPNLASVAAMKHCGQEQFWERTWGCFAYTPTSQ